MSIPPLRIFVADHDEVIRNVIATAVLVRDGWQICGEASTGAEAVAKIGNLKPDLVLMDIDLTSTSGLDATRRIVQEDQPNPSLCWGRLMTSPPPEKLSKQVLFVTCSKPMLHVI